MLNLRYHAYRYADAVLDHRSFRDAKKEIEQVICNAPIPLLDPENPNPKTGGVKFRKRKSLRSGGGDRYLFLPVDQKALNTHLDREFVRLEWEPQPTIVSEEVGKGPETGLKGDFKKGRLQVEIQFGNMARWYTDVFKFQLSYALGAIDVGVLVVPTQEFSNLIDENIAYFERVTRELPWAKMSLTLPILVIGVEPIDYSPIRACYKRAAEVLIAKHAAEGKAVSAISFEDRIREQPPPEETEATGQ
jgi:hypothetical protein